MILAISLMKPQCSKLNNDFANKAYIIICYANRSTPHVSFNAVTFVAPQCVHTILQVCAVVYILLTFIVVGMVVFNDVDGSSRV